MCWLQAISFFYPRNSYRGKEAKNLAVSTNVSGRQIGLSLLHSWQDACMDPTNITAWHMGIGMNSVRKS